LEETSGYLISGFSFEIRSTPPFAVEATECFKLSCVGSFQSALYVGRAAFFYRGMGDRTNLIFTTDI
jgi:hypothetical protein